MVGIIYVVSKQKNVHAWCHDCNYATDDTGIADEISAIFETGRAARIYASLQSLITDGVFSIARWPLNSGYLPGGIRSGNVDRASEFIAFEEDDCFPELITGWKKYKSEIWGKDDIVEKLINFAMGSAFDHWGIQVATELYAKQAADKVEAEKARKEKNDMEEERLKTTDASYEREARELVKKVKHRAPSAEELEHIRRVAVISFNKDLLRYVMKNRGD